MRPGGASTVSNLFNPFPVLHPHYDDDSSTELSPALVLATSVGPDQSVRLAFSLATDPRGRHKSLGNVAVERETRLELATSSLEG